MLFKVILSTYANYCKALFTYKGDYFLAGKCLKGKMNGIYRLDETDKTFRLLGFKVVKRSLLRFFGKKFILIQLAESGVALIDEDPTKSNTERIDFIERVLKKKVMLYLSKEELMGYPMSFFNKLLVFIVIIIHGMILIPICFLSKNRVFHALVLYYVIESALALYYLKINKINTVVISNIYSQDSNINFLLMSKHGIHIIKNPSEDALVFDNSILLSDELIICNPYQQEEIETIKTVKIKSIIHGLPEQINRYEEKYGSKFYQPQRKVIGYYSSGSWLRKQYSRLYIHAGVDCAYQEELLLMNLKKFIEKNAEYSLRIFQHPIEKNNALSVELTNGYYKKILGDINFTKNDLNLQTCLSFEGCDTAISLFSGSSLYRLVFGYKSLFYSPINSFNNFPVKDSSLGKINIGNKPDFNTFLIKQLNMSEGEFFTNHQLENYKYAELLKRVGETEMII